MSSSPSIPLKNTQAPKSIFKGLPQLMAGISDPIYWSTGIRSAYMVLYVPKAYKQSSHFSFYNSFPSSGFVKGDADQSNIHTLQANYWRSNSQINHWATEESLSVFSQSSWTENPETVIDPFFYVFSDFWWTCDLSERWFSAEWGDQSKSEKISENLMKM